MSRTDELLQQIQTNAGAVDSSNAPAELSQAELMNHFEKLGKDDLSNKQSMTNNTELFKLLANRPHTTAYIRDVMGIKTAEAVSEAHAGESFELYIPEKPRVGYDGYRLKLATGDFLDIKKANIKKWMLENTLGRVAGGTSGKGLILQQRGQRRQGFGGQKNIVIVRPLGVDASNPEDYIETFEKAVDPQTQEPITREITVSLSKTTEVANTNGEGNRTVRLRGVVRGFPVWQRKADFISTLGPLKVATSDAKLLRIEDEAVDQAMLEVLQMAHLENVEII